jgi:NAD-dependent deacetylase
MTGSEPGEAECGRAAELLSGCSGAVALTGAGMSQESGVPTFRDALTGWWARYDPMQLATPEAYHADPARVFGWYVYRWRMARQVEPHAGHLALTDLAGCFDRFAVVTQNVDGLHGRAGSEDIIELHGSLEAFRCVGGHPFDPERFRDLDLPEEGDVEPPACDTCGSPIRPGVVWFGEQLSSAAIGRAHELVTTCDALLVVGTSSVVYPAAGLPDLALGAGVTVIEINPDRTPLSSRATLHWSATAGEALPRLAAALAHLIEPDRPAR